MWSQFICECHELADLTLLLLPKLTVQCCGSGKSLAFLATYVTFDQARFPLLQFVGTRENNFWHIISIALKKATNMKKCDFQYV